MPEAAAPAPLPLKPGLVSVSFRALAAEAVLDLAQKSGLKGVEWGGDVHVPHGDLEAAHRVGERTRDAGLEVAAYGSYYRLGGGKGSPDFADALASAVALGAPLLRVWAGVKGGAEHDERERARVTRDAERVCTLAASEGVRVGLEYHAGTLTDTPESTARLLREAGHPGLLCFWQPPVGLEKQACLEGLEALARSGRLGSLHVFHWWPDAASRLPLEQGEDRWTDYLTVAARAAGKRFCCLEFVRGDVPDQLKRDAAALKRWLEKAEQGARGA